MIVRVELSAMPADDRRIAGSAIECRAEDS